MISMLMMVKMMRHELETQEEKLEQEKEKLRKIKEKLEFDAQLAAATAKLSVLEDSDEEMASSNGMNSSMSKGLKEQTLELDATAKEFVPKAKQIGIKHSIMGSHKWRFQFATYGWHQTLEYLIQSQGLSLKMSSQLQQLHPSSQ